MPNRFLSRFFRRKKIRDEDSLQISELRRIEDLIQQGKLEKALAEVERIENRGELGENSHLKSQLLKSIILIQQGASDRGLELAEQLFNEGQQLGNALVMVEALISRAKALLGLGRLSKCLQVIQEGEELLSSKRFDKFQHAVRDSALKHLKGIVYRKQGDLDPALEVLKECLATRQDLGNSHVIAEALNDIGIIYASKGEFNSAVEYLEQAMAIFENLGNQPPIIKIRNNIGMIYWQTGQLDLALKFFQESYALSEELGNKRFIAAIATNIGLILWQRGELTPALDHYHKGLEIYETLAYKTEMTTNLNNIGIIHSTRGELDLALDCYQRSLALAEEQGNKREIAASLNNIGLVYRDQGNQEAAIPHFERSWQLYEEIGNDFNTCEPLYRLVELVIHEASPEDAQPYLDKLREMNGRGENKLVSQKYRLAQAILLKTSGRLRDRSKAEKLLEQVIEEEIIDHGLTVTAMLHLCNLLLAELRTFNDPEMLRDVQALVDKLLAIAEQQYGHGLLAETLVLKSKLALVEANLHEGRRFLSQAQVIAEEWGLGRLARQISDEHDTLLRQTDQWDDLRAGKPSLRDFLEFANVDELVERMTRRQLKTIPDQPPEEPIMMLIMSKGGLSLFSHTFYSGMQVQDQLLGGFLTAVQNLAAEIMAGTESLDRIMYQEHTIALKAHDPLMFCYIFKGSSYGALHKLEHFMDAINTSPALWKELCRSSRTGIALAASEQQTLEKCTTDILLASSVSA